MYERNFGLAVSQGKMSEARSQELQDKIQQVVAGGAGSFAGTESDIRVVHTAAGVHEIDLVVHAIKADENDPERINVSYATCRATIRHASTETVEKTKQMLNQIVSASLGFMTLPGGEEELAKVKAELEEQGKKLIVETLMTKE